MVFISNGKLHVSVCGGHHQVLTNFLAIRVMYNMHKPRGDVEISSSVSFANDNDDEISISPRVYAYYI